jgi:hypothetical protein
VDRLNTTVSSLIGQQLSQIWVWEELRLIFEMGDRPEPSRYLDVSEFELAENDGGFHSIDVAPRPEDAAPILGRLRQQVSAASVRDGTIAIDFADGWRLVCRPHTGYEAWRIRAEGTTVVCLPGGDIASW